MSRIRWLFIFSLCATDLSAAHHLLAQVVPVRTVPVASGDQFLMLPSESMAMGGVTLAIDDPLGDAWSNPAKGSLVTESAFVGSPTFYSISNGGGGGRTLPVAGLFAGARWFGGAALALQQVEDAGTGGGPVFGPQIDWWEPPRRLGDGFSRNLYASGYVGVRLGGAWSLGVGGAASALDAMDGVDLLYSGAERIEQSGGTRDARLGVHREGATDQLSLLLLHSRVSMTHDVTYIDGWVLDSLTMTSRALRRVELNQDQTRTWGTHLEWARDLGAPGWRVGASATVNYKDHPKIPNYEIQSIPRDPGTTWAYEAALGFARVAGPTTFAFEVALQPIRSETWQEADTTDVRLSNGDLAVGDRSIVNDFFFTNVMLRTGFSHEVERVTLQAGLEVRSYAYSLEQVSHVFDTYREQDETWMEWTPTFGVTLSFTGLEVLYAGRVTTGTGLPGVDFGGGIRFASTTINQMESDFILAPGGPLTLQEARVVTHQIGVRIPVR